MNSTAEPVFSRPFFERREQSDRREFSWHTFWHGIFSPRRRAVRRQQETVAQHLDWYEPQLMFVAVLILLLSLLDALLTLSLLPKGAIEWNPLMRFLIETNVSLFILSKLLVTGFSLVCLIALGRFRLFSVISLQHILGTIVFMYGCLITYETMLLLKY